MFSGIIETIGEILAIIERDSCKHFTIRPKENWQDYVIGESIAINGTCLTVTDFTDTTFNVTAVPETLRLTNLNNLKIGSSVNLEKSLRANSRIGGHFVQGHIDSMAQILEIAQEGSAQVVKIAMPSMLNKYIVKKGFITLDGMSITIKDITNDSFTVTFIPHTQAITITHHYKIGDWINIEVDIMGKYIEKLLGATYDKSH